jgi:threonine/homoserine/homoserine lactone efflux protein
MAVRDVVLLIGTIVGVAVLAHSVNVWLALCLCAAYLVWLRFQRPKLTRLLEILSSE